MMNPPKRILVSYSHDSDEHRRLVRQLADSLKENGFDVSFDQYLPEDPPEGWPLWMEKEIRYAHKVLMVCTESYLRRVQKEEVPGKGRGVCWEANLIYAELYLSQTKSNKFIPVILREEDRQFVPMPLGASSVFRIEDGADFEKLFRSLSGQANHAAPPTGSIPHLPVPKPLPTFKLKAASDSSSTVSVTTPAITEPTLPPVLPPSPATILRSLKPNTPPPSRFELRQLDWYEEADAEFFRGREADVKSLRSLLLDQPVVRLFGSSGVGKSSLLRAGLVPELRRHGFRSVVVRPFKNPEETIPQQISQQLLSADSPPLSSGLNLERLQAELGPAFAAEQCPYLFVLIDQVEDVVSPLVPLEARERLVSFLQQVWNAGSTSPPLIRALVAYRTDADARLGPLWQEVSGASVGLPYHAIQGLTRDVARRVLADALTQSSQPTTVPLDDLVDDLIDELVRESLSLDASGDVFPPYLQMMLAQLEDSSESCVLKDQEASADSVLKITSAGDLIRNYMQNRLGQLESRGGDFAKCRDVLAALSRSTGQKLTLTLGELAAEVRLSRDAILPLLDALMASRLVRPVGDSYEVQHDRLAETVVLSLPDSDREFKAARELLAAKAVNHARTGEWLTPKECHLLYCHHGRLNPSRSELRLLLGSLLVENDLFDSEPGWLFHFRKSESQAALYRELARDKDTRVRAAAVQAIASFQNPEDLPLLRSLTQDKAVEVVAEAANAIASFQNAGDLLRLRELAHDKSPQIRVAAAEAIASFQNPEDLPLLRELSVPTSDAVVPLIGSFRSPEALRLLGELAVSDDTQIGTLAVSAIASYQTPEALLLLKKLALDLDSGVSDGAVKAISSFRNPDTLLLLRELAGDKNNYLRQAAVRALTLHKSRDDLPLLRELARDENLFVLAAAIRGIAEFQDLDDLPLMRELAVDANPYVRQAAVRAIAGHQNSEDRPLLRGLGKMSS